MYVNLKTYMWIHCAPQAPVSAMMDDTTRTCCLTLQVDIRLQRSPYPEYNNDAFIIVLQGQFPLFLMFIYLCTVPCIAKDVVQEKEKKLKVRNVAPSSGEGRLESVICNRAVHRQDYRTSVQLK